VTHDEVRLLLPAYASGELNGAASAAVRAHLASCTTCFADVFNRPVGVPRAVPRSQPATEPPSARPAIAGAASPRKVTRVAPLPVDAGPTPPRPPPSAEAQPHIEVPTATRRGWGFGRSLAVAAALLALALIGLLAWTIVDLRTREAHARADAARAAERLRAREAAHAEVMARLAAIERELAAVRAEAAQLAAAARAVNEGNAQLRRDLEAAAERAALLARTLQRRERELNRLRMDAEEQFALRELVGSPGAAILPLEPVAPFKTVRGHVLWHPARDAIVLYGFALPSPPAGGRYRVRLALDDGRIEPGPAFNPDGRGEIALPIRLKTEGALLRDVEVVLEPGGEPVLAARRNAR
jgi:hypothetical protein